MGPSIYTEVLTISFSSSLPPAANLAPLTSSGRSCPRLARSVSSPTEPELLDLLLWDAWVHRCGLCETVGCICCWSSVGPDADQNLLAWLLGLLTVQDRNSWIQ